MGFLTVLLPHICLLLAMGKRRTPQRHWWIENASALGAASATNSENIGSADIANLAATSNPQSIDLPAATSNPSAVLMNPSAAPSNTTKVVRPTVQALSHPDEIAAKSQNAVRSQSDAMLLDARRMMAHGDLHNAQIKVEQARGLGVSYNAL